MSSGKRWPTAAPWILLVLAAVGAVLAANTRLSDGSTSASVRVVGDGRELARVAVDSNPAVTRQRLRVALGRLPVEATTRRGSTSITYRHNRLATAARAERLLSTGGTIAAVRWPVASWISAAAIRQVLRNTCEAGALAILLSSAGVRVPRTGSSPSFRDPAHWIRWERDRAVSGETPSSASSGARRAEVSREASGYTPDRLPPWPHATGGG